MCKTREIIVSFCVDFVSGARVAAGENRWKRFSSLHGGGTPGWKPGVNEITPKFIVHRPSETTAATQLSTKFSTKVRGRIRAYFSCDHLFGEG